MTSLDWLSWMPRSHDLTVMKEVQFFKNKGHVYNHDSGGSHVGSKQAFSNAYTGFNYDASISHNPAPCIKLI